MSTLECPTAPVFLPQVSIPDAWDDPVTEPQSRENGRSVAIRPPANPLAAAKVAESWQLTDRGIAVIMVLAAVIMTVALAVIGLTAMHVTSAGYDAGLHSAPQAQH